MLAIPLRLYQTGLEYPVRSPILLVGVTPALQSTCGYFLLVAYLIFERYFPLMNVLHVYLLSKRHQFPSFWPLMRQPGWYWSRALCWCYPFSYFFIGSVCITSCVEVWHKISPGDCGSPHSSVGATIVRLYKSSLMFTNSFWYHPPGWLLEDFSCFMFLNAYASSLGLFWV